MPDFKQKMNLTKFNYFLLNKVTPMSTFIKDTYT